jgi:hypothetical protein
MVEVKNLILEKIKKFKLYDPYNEYVRFCDDNINNLQTNDIVCFISYNIDNMHIKNIFMLHRDDMSLQYGTMFLNTYVIYVKEELRNLTINEIIKS